MGGTTGAAKLRAWRIASGLSQAAAAERLGVGQGTWSAWEQAAKRPELEMLLDLQQLTLGAVTVHDWVLTDEEREVRRLRRGGRPEESTEHDAGDEGAGGVRGRVCAAPGGSE